VISFAGGLPAPELFDAAGTRAAFAAALEEPGRTLQYSTTEGDAALRAAVAARLTACGLPTTADELLITSGSQQALTLAATALIGPGVGDLLYFASIRLIGMARAFPISMAAWPPSAPSPESACKVSASTRSVPWTT
jgi:2-aminoadipate transaminase